MWPFKNKEIQTHPEVTRKLDACIGTQAAMDARHLKVIADLGNRLSKLEACDITEHNIYRTVEDLKNRVPKGSAVSDHRFNELAGTVARLERLIGEMNAAWANAKREQENYLEERRSKTTVSRAVKELPAQA